MSQTRNSHARSAAAEAVKALESLPETSTPAVRRLRKTYTAKWKISTPAAILEIADMILERGDPAARLFGFELIHDHPGALALVGEKRIGAWIKDIADWGSTDLLGVVIVGPLWRARHILDRRIHEWARSQNRWLRRLALVATVPLNAASRGGDGDAQRTLAIARRLVDDRDDMVVKALSWSLRELAKRDPGVVRGFVDTYALRLAARVKREVTTKHRTGKKN